MRTTTGAQFKQIFIQNIWVSNTSSYIFINFFFLLKKSIIKAVTQQCRCDKYELNESHHSRFGSI